MEDIPYDAVVRKCGAVTTRRLTVGALLAGALGRLGLGEVNAKRGKRKNTNGRDGQTRMGDATGRGSRAAAAAKSGSCTPGCGACQQCKQGKCRKTNSGRKRCQTGMCLAAGTGTACTPATGGSGTCQAGSCVPVGGGGGGGCTDGLTDCSGVCKNLQTDPAHCGQCGKVCAAQQVCVASGCCFPDGTPGVCTADNFLDVCCPGPTGQRGCEINIRGGPVGTCVAL